MKLTFTVLIFFLFCNSHAQIKGDNLIVINTGNTQEQNFLKFGQYITSKGLSIDKKDMEFFIIETLPKTIYGQLKYVLHASFVDNVINVRIRHTYANNAAWLDFQQQIAWKSWEYHKSKSSTQYRVYQAVNDLLIGFHNNIIYTKE